PFLPQGQKLGINFVVNSEDPKETILTLRINGRDLEGGVALPDVRFKCPSALEKEDLSKVIITPKLVGSGCILGYSKDDKRGQLSPLSADKLREIASYLQTPIESNVIQILRDPNSQNQKEPQL